MCEGQRRGTWKRAQGKTVAAILLGTLAACTVATPSASPTASPTPAPTPALTPSPVATPTATPTAPEIGWLRQFGSAEGDTAFAVAVDASGVYVAGSTGGALAGQTSAGGGDAFVRKYDPGESELWTRQFGSAYGDYTFAVAVDASGVYVAGNTSGALAGQTNAGEVDAFVRKYHPGGSEP